MSSVSALQGAALLASDVALSASPLGDSQCLNVPATIGQDGLVIDINGSSSYALLHHLAALR